MKNTKRLSHRILEIQKDSQVIEFQRKISADDMSSILLASHIGMSIAVFGEARLSINEISGGMRYMKIDHQIETYPDGVLFYINKHKDMISDENKDI